MIFQWRSSLITEVKKARWRSSAFRSPPPVPKVIDCLLSRTLPPTFVLPSDRLFLPLLGITGFSFNFSNESCLGTSPQKLFTPPNQIVSGGDVFFHPAIPAHDLSPEEQTDENACRISRFFGPLGPPFSKGMAPPTEVLCSIVQIFFFQLFLKRETRDMIDR